MGRIAGIDYGARRVGVALSDPTHFIASPHSVIDNRGLPGVVRELRALCEAQDVERIVVGWPINMDGSEGPATETVRAFMDRLAADVDLPLERWDERLSTKTAEAALIEAGTRREKRKGLVDKIAAQVLLQHYLDSRA